MSSGSKAATVLWSREVAQTAPLRWLHRTPLEDRWPHEDLPLKPPPPRPWPSRPAWHGLDGPSSRSLMSTSAFAASIVFLLIISFIPSAPRWLYFTAHRLQCQDSHSHDQEINVWAPRLPFFPFLFDVKDKAMFQIFATCFGRLCRVVTFGPVTMPQPRWCLTPTFLSGGRRKKTVVVLYFPSLDEGNAGGETLELGRRLERNLSERL